MILKRRGQQLALYRSRWVAKGPGVPHGYAVQDYIGSIAADADAIPQDLALKLTPPESLELERRVFVPARQARQLAQQAAERRERDPIWRLLDAQKLVVQAAELSQGAPVSRHYMDALQRELSRVQFDAPPAPAPALRERPQDALGQALNAVRAAAQAVREGAYGRAPATGVRETRTYKLWAELVEAVDGGQGSLLRALQDRGFAKSRKS